MNLNDSVQVFAKSALTLTDADLEAPWDWGDYDEGLRFAFFRVYEELRTLAARVAAACPPQTEAQRVMGQYSAAHRDLQAVLLGVPADLFETPPAPEHWHLRRTFSHMLSAEKLFWAINAFALDRFRRGLEPAKMEDSDYDPLLGTEEEFRASIDQPSLEAFNNAFAESRRRVLAEFAASTDAEMDAPAHYWESRPFSLRFRLHRFDAHMRQHTIQVEKTLAALGHPPSEVKRLLRLIYNAWAEAEAALIGAENPLPEETSQTAEAIAKMTEAIRRNRASR